MRYVAVVWLDLLVVLHPLHDTPIGAEGGGLQLAQCRGEAVDEGAVTTKSHRRLARRGEELAQDLIVHRRASRYGDGLALGRVVAVLRRGRGDVDEVAALGILDQRREEEACCTLHHGIDALEVSAVLAVAIVIVEVLTEPSGGGIRGAPAGMLARGGELPYVAEDVRDPALSAIEGACCTLTRRYDALDPIRERPDGLGECALLGRPVVHL